MDKQFTTVKAGNCWGNFGGTCKVCTKANIDTFLFTEEGVDTGADADAFTFLLTEETYTIGCCNTCSDAVFEVQKYLLEVCDEHASEVHAAPSLKEDKYPLKVRIDHIFTDVERAIGIVNQGQQHTCPQCQLTKANWVAEAAEKKRARIEEREKEEKEEKEEEEEEEEEEGGCDGC